MIKEKIPSIEQFRFHHDLEVRFRDLDAMGHVNNVEYFAYFEDARTHYMKELGLVSDSGNFSDLLPFILLDAHCRFLSSVALGQKLVVHLRTSRIGTKSFEFEYLITDKDDGRAIAVGSSAQVCYDYRAKSTQAVPDDLRQQIEAFEGRKF